MSTTIEALYIYDEANEPIVEHIYTSRPPSAKALLSQYLAHPAPRPSLLYLPGASPPTTVLSVIHAPLLLLCPSRSDAQPLAVLEFLHRVVDVFEEFLGAPLLSGKIETNYDVVAQLLGEMCDGGVICNTEGNALRESVEVSGVLGKLFTQVGLPGSSPALAPSGTFSSALKASPNLNSGPAIPWRRSNVRHTSNELYVDIVETLSVILAPSGQPISAIAAGSIAFTAKISGIPDLLLVLSARGGTSSAKSSGIARTMQLAVFHPCVRLAWWKEHPGELSFVPPDGRFVLAGYEVDLLPSSTDADKPPSHAEKLFLPASVDIRNGLGAIGSDFEIKLTLNNNFPGTSSSSKPGPSSSRLGAVNTPFSFGGSGAGSTSAPTLEAVVVTAVIPDAVRNVADLRCSRGEATYSHWTKTLEWKVPTKDGATVNGTATLSGTIVGPIGVDDGDEDIENGGTGSNPNPLLGYYDEDSAAAAGTAEPYQGPPSQTSTTAASLTAKSTSTPAPSTSTPSSLAQQRKAQANKALMPTSVAVSFSVRGWLPSGIKVDSLNVDVRRSKGLGEGVKPYKGVKYVTVSKNGIERRV